MTESPKVRLHPFVAAIALLFPGCPQSSPAPEKAAAEAKVDWASAFKHEVRYDPARTALVADLTIAPGFHAYTTGETIGKPLQLEVEGAESLLDGAIAYPPGKAKDMPIGRSVIVEGKAEIVAKLKPAPGSTAKGLLRYQVCTETACDRPKSAPFTVALPNSESSP